MKKQVRVKKHDSLKKAIPEILGLIVIRVPLVLIVEPCCIRRKLLKRSSLFV